MAGDVREIQSLFYSGISATDHGNWFIAVKEAVTCGASRHAFAHERGFAWQPKILRACACRDDD